MNFPILIKFTAGCGIVAGVISVVVSCEEVTTPKPPVGYGTKYIPSAEEVNLRVVNVRGRINVWLSINFPDSGFAVLDWGTPEPTASGFVVNAQTIHWMGITLPVVSPWKHRCNLGFLSPGEYEFEFRTWGEPVKVFRFKVDSVPIDINQDGQFSTADLVVLAKVVSNSPVVISGQVYQAPYPSWLLETCDINGDGQVDITDLISAFSPVVKTTE